MKKLQFFLFIILIILPISSIYSYNIKVTTNKNKYLRYELVSIFCDLKIPQKKINIFKNKKITIQDKINSKCYAKVFYKNRLVKTVGNTDILYLKYNPAMDKWIGKWPIPWNPKTGKYKILVVLKINKKKYANITYFTITKRKPMDLERGFCVMDIEPGDSIIKRVPGVKGKTVRIWENYILWAKFMGASALWHNVGQSQIWNSFSLESFPWDEVALRQIPKIAKKCHKYNIKYGAWITSYVVLGNRLDLSPYRQTTGYDEKTGKLKKLIYISIYDQKRQEDIIKLLQRLNKIKNIDFLGLDYMRTDFGGYEYTDNFVLDMPVNRPKDFFNLPKEERMIWLAKKIEVEKDLKIIDMWNWWRAHKMSIIINEIKIKSGINKPLWIFNLTWDTAHEHGQDPIMFIDAGVDINASMFYSIEKKTYPVLLQQWKRYLKKSKTALLAGQCVDWYLLGKTFYPPGPEEHFLRQKMLIDKLYNINPNMGLFWHDLTRAFKKTRGPYSALEWAIAGAASFSYLRKKQNFFPFEIKWDVPDRVISGDIFTVDITVKNTNDITMDFYLKLLKIKNLELFGDIVHKFYLAPGERKTFTFQIRTLKKHPEKGNMQMVAFLLQYNGKSTQQRYFDFKYIQVR